MGDMSSFPAENDVAGRLLLSGADALGANPWNRPRPTLADYHLKPADLDDAAVAKARRANAIERRQLGARVISSFLLPLFAVAAAYYIIEGIPSLDVFEPRYEWVVYLGASLILAAIVARVQTMHHEAAVETHNDLMSIADRRMAFAAGERDWAEEQKRRTTTDFWLRDIPRIAAEKGTPAGTVFAQEVGKLFVAWNWQVRLNQRAEDYGVDIFTSGKEGSAVVQCKHGPDGPSTHDIRDLAGSRHAFGSDYGLMVSIHPPLASRQNEFYSEKGQLEFWHLGHILEQCIALYKQRTGEDAPADDARRQFLNADGTPIAWHPGDSDAKAAAE
jgi:hypothetical protein